ncbi:MAG: YbaB/EbfC family nucleoid-associated protein [Candidatus Hinthialibacter antarcticus]|nr:YbaB/EbfC family nucleoid-associated protein [Candidatus Hinthialibacter antarcticus]
MKGLGNIGNLFAQAKQMQQKMADIQAELERESVTGSAGGGMVQVTMNGKQKITAIKIEPDIVDPSDLSMLEDLIVVAVNEAQDRVQEVVKERMTSLTGGIDIPGITS